MTARARSRRREGRAPLGQGLVEFAMIIPVFLLIVVGMLEFGFLFDQAMTLNYATREGARSGAAFAAGNSSTMICDPADFGLEVDKNIVAAVQRVLDAPGSRVNTARIDEIRIYKALAGGVQDGSLANIWRFSDGSGPAVDGSALDFRRSTTNWSACNRDNTWNGTNAPDSLGVSITYTYDLVTPLGSLLGFFGPGGPGSFPITDRTVMALNPTNR